MYSDEVSIDFKDHFSDQADSYARFRPTYPDPLFEWLASLAPACGLAWDCATGSGQAARALAAHFGRVVATDASAEQVARADVGGHANLAFGVASAETSGLAADSVDLVTVAQALHWFDRERFYREVDRVLRPGGVLAVWTYELALIDPVIDRYVADWYRGGIDPYWPPERALVESGYRGIELPYAEVAVPDFEMVADWSLPELLGYLGSWSAVQRYRVALGRDPVADLARSLGPVWGEPGRPRRVAWPLVVRVTVKPMSGDVQ